ncbi:MAG: 1-acyl-sn-glycerol-3-phosphate acyltransferase [Deltaproteobacteria bacterium]|nr:1-acyl-sn-glycerol-3-phosphate acyltransferase [Deltaproteobacteria bacterium]
MPTRDDAAPSPARPRREPLAWSRAELESRSWFERTSVRAVTFVHARAWAKAPFLVWVHTFTNWFAWRFVGRVLRVEHAERLGAIASERPVVVMANHLTFWDLYILSAVLYRRTGVWRDYYFPVRARFFYENPAGFLLNVLFAGLTMFPPFFQSDVARRLDVEALRILDRVAGRRRALVGFHPEGTRNKTGNPYQLLPARAATKRVLQTARRAGAVVIPIFMNGLDGGMHRTLGKNLLKTGVIHVMIGEPIEPAAFLDEAESAGADPVSRIMDVLHDLAAEERALREAAPESV